MIMITPSTFKERLYKFGEALNGDESHREQEMFQFITELYTHLNTMRRLSGDAFYTGYEVALINLEDNDREFCIKAILMDIKCSRRKNNISKNYVSSFEAKGEEDE